MADMKIDDATRDSQVTGAELLPASDGGEPKAVSTEKIKDYVLAQIAALTAAGGVDASADGVYLLKGGALKPVSAAMLAAMVVDWAFAQTGIVAVNGNETVAVKDSGVKKTMSVAALKTYILADAATKTALDALTAAVAGKVDAVAGKGLSTNDYTNTDKAKLDAMTSNAQADWEEEDSAAASFIKNKPEIPSSLEVDETLDTESQNPVANSAVAEAVDSINDALDDRPTGAEVAAALEDKVDKVAGKGLSTNDYTTAEKNRLASLADGRMMTIYSDLDEVSGTYEPYDLGTIPAGCAALLFNAPAGDQGDIEAAMPSGSYYWLSWDASPEWVQSSITACELECGYYYIVRRMDIASTPHFLFTHKLPNTIE